MGPSASKAAIRWTICRSQRRGAGETGDDHAASAPPRRQTHDTLFTATEAAVLTGLPLKAVNNAIDGKTVSAAPGPQGGWLPDAHACLARS